jgi:GntR family L-lactate dehydrogenase operon transcriptional regulator
MSGDIGDPRYIRILEVIETDGIIGACKAQCALMDAGIEVSEPTAGRALRDMERQGLLEKDGRRGRRLTDLGRRSLHEYLAEQRTIELTNDFAKSLNPTEKEELLDILVARRAIEVELAKLAATQISQGDIRRLRETVAESKKLFDRHKSVAPMDTKFHMIIAAASRNRTLSAALELIWHGGEYSKKLERIRYNDKVAISDDHEAIIEALEESDPEKAGKKMESHLNGVLRDVEAIPNELMDCEFAPSR